MRPPKDKREPTGRELIAYFWPDHIDHGAASDRTSPIPRWYCQCGERLVVLPSQVADLTKRLNGTS